MTSGLRFPKKFVWGAATSAYQIEGAFDEDGRGESIWDRFSHTPGTIADGSNGDVAADHYHLYLKDIELMRELGLNAYRFSIAWPRILPTGTGAVNEPGLVFYERLVDALLNAGIDPWVTLYHWDLPTPLQDVGGWPNRDTAYAFEAYADVVTRRLGDRVKNWFTINEPWRVSFLSHQIGIHAPGETDWGRAIAAAHHVLLAHGLAVPVIRANSPEAKVGICLNPTSVYPATNSEADRSAASRFDGHINRWFLDPIADKGYPLDIATLYMSTPPPIKHKDMEIIAAKTDLLGVNYYTPSYITDAPDELPLRATGVDRPDLPHTDLSWIVEPKGLLDLLVRLETDYELSPIYIAENGAAYDDDPPIDGRVHDPERKRYLETHLTAIHEAIRLGVDVRGYLPWSLIDNFEWAEGYAKRFGLVYVDYSTQERTIKDSGHWYASVARVNGFDTEG